MAEPSPAYLWYPKDVISSGRVAALSPLEELWYRRSLDQSWLHEGMPDDPAEFAGWVGRGCTVKGAEKIIEKFFTFRTKVTGKVFNQKQEQLRKELRRKSRERSKAGIESGRKRRERSKLEAEQMFNKTETNLNIPSSSSIPISLSSKKQSGDEFIAELRSNPDYSHIQVDVELSRAEAWARDKGRQFTRRFVTSWFGRVEAPLNISTNGNGNSNGSAPQWKIDQDACELCDDNGYVLKVIPHKVCKHQ